MKDFRAILKHGGGFRVAAFGSFWNIGASHRHGLAVHFWDSNSPARQKCGLFWPKGTLGIAPKLRQSLATYGNVNSVGGV